MDLIGQLVLYASSLVLFILAIQDRKKHAVNLYVLILYIAVNLLAFVFVELEPYFAAAGAIVAIWVMHFALKYQRADIAGLGAAILGFPYIAIPAVVLTGIITSRSKTKQPVFLVFMNFFFASAVLILILGFLGYFPSSI